MRADLKVFHKTLYTTMTEVQDQAVQKFNEAVRGGLVLTSSTLNQGDFDGEVMWAKIQGLVRRRNAYADGAIASKQLSQLVNYSVKVAGGIFPIAIDPGMMKWIKKSQAEAGAVIGKQMAEDNLADMLNTAIAALVAGLSTVPEVNYDGTANPAGGTASLINLNNGAAKFGDRNQDIRAWLMHSKSIFDIYGNALVNQERLFQFGTVNVVTDGFGRPLIYTDSPALMVPAAEETLANYYQIGLNAAAATVEQNNDEFTDNIDTRNGNENIQATYQAEWTYNLGLRGFTWDTTAGGKSPTNAALATAANWDKTATYYKDGPGVLVKTL